MLEHNTDNEQLDIKLSSVRNFWIMKKKGVYDFSVVLSKLVFTLQISVL